VRNYPDEPEQRWYSDRYPREGDDRYDGYRVPDPRYEEQRGWAFDTAGESVPRTSQELPPPAREEPERYPTQPVSTGFSGPTSPGMSPPMPPLAPPGPGAVPPGPVPAGPPPTDPGANVYRTRRAGAAIVLIVGSILAEILLLRVLIVGEFGDKASSGGVLAGLFALAGVPLVARGLHGLAAGAASAGNSPGRQWLRVPLGYLPVGLVLLLAAALAVR
jgi:hypothetical protein